jgi:hypothetical protein
VHALPVVRVAALQHRVGPIAEADRAGLELVEAEPRLGVDVVAHVAQAAGSIGVR